MTRTRAERLPVEARRPLVLDAALELLAGAPAERPSMEAIARRAGVTKPSVYNCFATRADLFSALAAREEQAIRGLVSHSLAGFDPAASGEEMLRTAFLAILESVEARPAAWRLVYPLAESHDESLTRRMLAVRAANLRATEEACHHYLARRGARDPRRDARLLARVVAGVLDQLIETVLAGDGPPPSALATWAAGLIARGEAALLE